MPSVVIAAHDEESVIGACLDALLNAGDDLGRELDVVVAANGCRDRTASVAGAHGARVVEIPEPGKSGALNRGDSVARGFPRSYLDADIVVPPRGLEHLHAALRSPGCLAAAPRRRLDVSRRPLLVRAYFAISGRLPAFDGGLFGRGLITLSEEGRSRFAEFPPLIADDLYLDSLFADDEKVIVDDVEVVVETPWRTSDLLRRLVRVRRGNAELRSAGRATGLAVEVRPSDRRAWLRDVVLPHPHLAPAGILYAAITLLAAGLARRPARDGGAWGRDESTRDHHRRAGDAA